MDNEIKIHKIAEKLVPCPKIIDNYIEEYIMNIFEDSRFKNYFSFFIKTHFLKYYINI